MMKKKFMTVLLATIMIMGMAVPAFAFTDAGDSSSLVGVDDEESTDTDEGENNELEEFRGWLKDEYGIELSDDVRMSGEAAPIIPLVYGEIVTASYISGDLITRYEDALNRYEVYFVSQRLAEKQFVKFLGSSWSTNATELTFYENITVSASASGNLSIPIKTLTLELGLNYQVTTSHEVGATYAVTQSGDSRLGMSMDFIETVVRIKEISKSDSSVTIYNRTIKTPTKQSYIEVYYK